MEQQGQSKVYLDILEKIKEIIETKQLKTGDKLPSERELSESLQVGRSSVREAFRALELLGLIETRKGEGTFISDFRNHRLVQILGGFILRNDQAKNDVVETKQLLEITAIDLIINNHKEINIDKWPLEENFNEKIIFERLLSETENVLLPKIWRILANFEKSLEIPAKQLDQTVFIQMINAINNQDSNLAKDIYKQHISKSLIP